VISSGWNVSNLNVEEVWVRVNWTGQLSVVITVLHRKVSISATVVNYMY
jgi:hypothetical protein